MEPIDDMVAKKREMKLCSIESSKIMQTVNPLISPAALIQKHFNFWGAYFKT